MINKEISVVLLTYNAEKFIHKLILNLWSQSVNTELIVIDSSSTDNTTTILCELNVNYIQINKEEFNHGRTRNLGISLARNEIIVFITQDALPISNNCIETLIQPFEKNPDLSIVFGKQIPYPETDIYGTFARVYNYPDKGYERNMKSIPMYGIKTFFNSNSFSSYRKSHLNSIGGFPEKIIMCEDSYVAAKLILEGKKIIYNSKSAVYHSHSYSIMQEFKRYFDIGVAYGSNKWMLTKFKSDKSQGLNYFFAEQKFLIRNSMYSKIPLQVLRTVCKFLGYALGKNHKKLPINIVKLISWHQEYWS